MPVRLPVGAARELSIDDAAVFVPTLAAALMWGVILFLGEMVSTFIAWGTSAAVHHAIYKLYCKLRLTRRFQLTRGARRRAPPVA